MQQRGTIESCAGRGAPARKVGRRGYLHELVTYVCDGKTTRSRGMGWAASAPTGKLYGGETLDYALLLQFADKCWKQKWDIGGAHVCARPLPDKEAGRNFKLHRSDANLCKTPACEAQLGRAPACSYQATCPLSNILSLLLLRIIDTPFAPRSSLLVRHISYYQNSSTTQPSLAPSTQYAP